MQNDTSRATNLAAHPSESSEYVPGSHGSDAHNWNSDSASGGIRIQGRHFVDGYNRVCNLRGVNLSGACKVPTNHDPEHWLENGSHKGVTFVGRPFPLDEADEHLARLRRWGLTFVRFNVTWEALEHAGPGQYDEEYLAYLRQLISLFPSYGITAFLSMHQDVWSRYSGGSGAPAWTLEIIGFDLQALATAGAAYHEGVQFPGRKETDRGKWPTGYQKLSAATMATIFWGGDTFVPKLQIEKDGEQFPAQQFLQEAYLNCFDNLAREVGYLPGVIGFQLMNEPHRGYISLPSLHEWDYNTDLHLHDFPSALESFALGAGHPTYVPHYTRSFPFPSRRDKYVLLNKSGRSVWRKDGPSQGECIWERHGVWGWDVVKGEAVVLRESYFVRHPSTGKALDWYTDFYFPFAKKWAKRVQQIAGEGKLAFLEAVPNEFCPPWPMDQRPPNFVYSPHWYDLNAMFKKAFGAVSVNVQGLSRGMFITNALYWGHAGAKKNYSLQIQNIVDAARQNAGEFPVVVGECGVPMDLNNAEAFTTGDFTWQARMMDALISALDSALVSFTLWNYNPLNDDGQGDFWNGENFSWFTRSQKPVSAKASSLLQTDVALDEGGRILPAIVRPYPAKVAGIPLRYCYSAENGSFELDYAVPSDQAGNARDAPSHPTILSRETEIFLPLSVTEGREVLVTGAAQWTYEPKRQTLFVLHNESRPGDIHKIRVSIEPAVQPLVVVEWKLERWMYASIALLVAILLMYLRL